MCRINMFGLSVFLLALCFRETPADEQKCGGVFDARDFVLESPNYPDNFDGNITCEFTFKNKKCPTEFLVEFLDFNVDCDTGGLQVYQDVLCGKREDYKVYRSEDGVLQVKFSSRNHRENSPFKIFVSRSSCDSDSTEIQPARTKRSFFKHHCGSNEIPSPYRHSPIQKESSFGYHHNPAHWILLKEQNSFENYCCAERYESTSFIISSPDFANGNSTNSDCIYHIYRANRNICRLTLNFLFYWNGIQTSYGCQNGYLEIDGKQICGCRIGLNLISIFDKRYGYSPKVIKYKSAGYPTNRFAGFAIEVTQEECPSHFESPLVFRYPRWINHNNFRWGNVRNEHEVSKFYYSHKVSNVLTSNKGDSTYIDTSQYNPLVLNGADDGRCSGWGVQQWTQLSQTALWRSMPVCSAIPVQRRCIEYRNEQGCFKSPGYPYFYPNNLNLCYRFFKLPGYCSVKLIMLDFYLQDSYNCNKDYLLLGSNKRFCGNKLFNTYSNLGFLNGTFEEITFVTDSSISCRGFKAWYQQIPCPVTTTPYPTTYPPVTDPITPPTVTIPPVTLPVTTTPPPITTAPTPTTTTPNPITTTTPSVCYREFNGSSFNLEYYGYEGQTCMFIIYKSTPDVCLLTLRFIVFDLPCEDEYLMINGNRYCGRLNSSTIDFSGESIAIVYYREETWTPIDLRFLINVRQDTDCTPDPELIPERLERNDILQYKAQIVENEDGSYEVTIYNLNDVMCGLIMKVPQYDEGNMCALLKSVEVRSDCIFLKDDSIYAPYVNGKIQLVLKSRDVFDRMKLKEVRCGESELLKPILQ